MTVPGLGHLEIAPPRNLSSTPTFRFFLLEKYRKVLQVPPGKHSSAFLPATRDSQRKNTSNGRVFCYRVLRGRDLHPRPPGYEPGELLLLHPAFKSIAKSRSYGNFKLIDKFKFSKYFFVKSDDASRFLTRGRVPCFVRNPISSTMRLPRQINSVKSSAINRFHFVCHSSTS